MDTKYGRLALEKLLLAAIRRIQPEVVFPTLPEGEDTKVRYTYFCGVVSPCSLSPSALCWAGGKEEVGVLCWWGWVVLGDCRRPCAQWLVDQCEEVGASEGDYN